MSDAAAGKVGYCYLSHTLSISPYFTIGGLPDGHVIAALVYYSKTTVVAVATTVLNLGSCTFLGRIFLRARSITRQSRPCAEDYTLAAASSFLVAPCICQLLVMDVKFKIEAVTAGRLVPDQSFPEDVIYHQQLFALAATEMSVPSACGLVLHSAARVADETSL